MGEARKSDRVDYLSGNALGQRLGMLIAGFLGVVMVHHPMLFSRLARIQPDPGDPRLINYLLEHSYLWVGGNPAHRQFWDIPFFYPAPIVAAYSDTLLTVAPWYWGWRAAGLLPDTAFQLWIVTNSALNYLAGYWLLRSGFRRGVVGSIWGAFLFAFAAPRANQVAHQQLAPQVYIVVTLMALLRIFSNPPRSRLMTFVLWSTAALSLVAQFYAGFYLGWFLVLVLAIASVWALFLPQYRPTLIGVIRDQWPAIGVAAVLATLAIRPLLARYLLVATEAGLPSYRFEVMKSIPDWRTWFYMGPESWLWGWTPRLVVFHQMSLEQAQRLGLGLLTPLVCLAGLIGGRRRPAIRLVGLSMLGLLILITRFPREVGEGAALGLFLAFAAELCWRARPNRDRWILVGLMVVLSLSLFEDVVLALAVLLTALAFGIGKLPAGGAGAVGRVLIMAAILGFFFFVSHGHRLLAPCAGVVTMVVIEAVPLLSGRTPSLRALALGTLVAIATLWLYPGDIIYWPQVARLIPGGKALRAVSRGLLLGLIPAALGFAVFFDEAWRRRSYMALAWALGLVCVLEQGVTTSSYDKFIYRADVAELARRVDRRFRAFYYSPRNPSLPMHEYHLNAMWAEIQTGVPTVNGYSGLAPPGWLPLSDAGVMGEADLDRLRQALGAWASRHRMKPEEIGSVVGEAPPIAQEGVSPEDNRREPAILPGPPAALE